MVKLITENFIQQTTKSRTKGQLFLMNVTNFDMTNQYSFIKSSILFSLYKWLQDVNNDSYPLTDLTFFLQDLTQLHILCEACSSTGSQRLIHNAITFLKIAFPCNLSFICLFLQLINQLTIFLFPRLSRMHDLYNDCQINVY